MPWGSKGSINRGKKGFWFSHLTFVTMEYAQILPSQIRLYYARLVISEPSLKGNLGAIFDIFKGF